MSRKLPPIPKVVHFATGPVKVSRRAGLMDNEKVFGIFNWADREILLDSRLRLHAAWLTLEHEKFHVILMDAGIQLDEVMEERLCDTVAAARVAEMTR
jgi:hypothetical protein